MNIAASVTTMVLFLYATVWFGSRLLTYVFLTYAFKGTIDGLFCFRHVDSCVMYSVCYALCECCCIGLMNVCCFCTLSNV